MAKKDKKLKVHKELEGFDIKIDENGEIISNLSIDELNEFLDKNVEDKKLIDFTEKWPLNCTFFDSLRCNHNYSKNF